ncbi:hypothetical protein D3C85_1444880 [compost metagenome]
MIIGPDLIVRDGRVVTEPSARDRHDKTLRGYKARLKADPKNATAEAGGPDHQEHLPHADDARHEGVLRLLQRRGDRQLLPRAVVVPCSAHVGVGASAALIRLSSCCASSATSPARSDAIHITWSRCTAPIASNHSLQSP